VVILTATLPPSEEKKFFQQMMIAGEMVTIFRGPTTRQNVRYQILQVETGNADEMVIRTVQEKLAEYPAGKIMVYGNSVGRVKQMATALECEAYYRDVDDKNEVFQRVVGATCRVVVATNALGLGIDIPDIRVVVHMDRIRSLRDFAQESGRAGRDGKVSESIMMVGESASDLDERVGRLYKGEQCCRVVLDEYLDGRMDRMGCEEGEEMCWVCSRKNGIEEASGRREEREKNERVEYQGLEQERQMIREQMQRMRSNDGLDVERFQQELQRWSEKCPYCYMGGEGGRAAEHGLMGCSMEGVERAQELFERMKMMIRYEKYCVCYGCGIPQAICRRFESNGKGSWRWVRERSCQYPDLMIGVVAAVITGNINGVGHSVIAWMEEENIDMEDDRQTCAWMGRKIYWGEMEAAMINKVFYRLVRNIG
jgi:Helicase conserved C-terminal domain